MITITLTAGKGASSGVDYNAYVRDYFSGFVPTGWPYILGGENTFEGDQIVLLDELAAKPRETRALVLDGEDFFYYFTGHSLSGTLQSVRLSTLGASYNPGDGSFDTASDGRIKGVSTVVEFSGLSISNPEGTEGKLHKTVVGLMGGSHDGESESDPTLLLSVVNGQSQKLIGSSKDDTYAGTAFGDRIFGNDGDDALKGKSGGDKIDGGRGSDTLTGGGDGDAFIFSTKLAASNIDRIKDFAVGEDVIQLSAGIFKVLHKGHLPDAEFVVGHKAADGNDHIIYNDDTGALSYDADGAGGGKSAVRFATLAKSLDLTADDFLVVA